MQDSRHSASGDPASGAAACALAVAVPFHNEATHLPAAIACLRAQHASSIPVVFVDNASTDGSAALVRACPEVGAGRWVCVSEPRVGKCYAMARAAAWCRDRRGATYVAFLDADTTTDAGWLDALTAALAAAPRPAGFVYSPCSFNGLDRVPVFAEAYRAVDLAIRVLADQVGWFGNSAAAAFAVDLIDEFLERAGATSEQGLRCSLLSLARGRPGVLARTGVRTSARRLLVSDENLRGWGFYDRTFYRDKDINSPHKAGFAASGAGDLAPAEVQRFYARQAVKISCRSLIPLAMFDRTGEMLARISSVFGPDVAHELQARLEGLEWSADYVTSDRFEARLRLIETTCADSALFGRVLHLIRVAAAGAADAGDTGAGSPSVAVPAARPTRRAAPSAD